MKNNKLTGILFAITFGLLVSSCADLDPLPWTQNDVFISSRIENNQVVYGLSFYSRSNKQLGSSTAISPSGIEYNMVAPGSSLPYEFWYDTPESEMRTSIPETGTYSFSAFTAGSSEEILGSDVLTSTTLEPTTIVSCEFDSLNTKLNITWDLVDEADYRYVFLLDDSGEQVYATGSASASDTTQSISASDNYWLATDIEGGTEGSYVPIAGETYTVEVALHLKDDSDEDYDYLQARSVATYDIVWQDEIEDSSSTETR